MARRTPRPSTSRQKLLAEFGLNSLYEQELEVVLIPAPEPKHADHKIRVVVNQNPEWYRTLTDRRLSGGALRRRVKQALHRVIDGRCDPVGLEEEILEELENEFS